MTKKIELESSKSIWDFWPMPEYEPRNSQIEALEWMQSLPAHIKYILCEIPVGGGKSPIALNYTGFLGKSNQLGTSFILTPQRILQRQYEQSFESKLLASVYGKGNYDCVSKDTNCDIGNDIKPKCENCPAKDAFNIGLKTPNMVLNYKLALLYFDILPFDIMPKRDLIVFDECHSLEGHLTDHRSLTISERRCTQLNTKFVKVSNMTEAQEWIRGDYWDALSVELKKLSASASEISDKCNFGAVMTPDEKRIMIRYKELARHSDLVFYIRNSQIDQLIEDYVLIPDKTLVTFKELYGKNIFHSLVKPRANKFLFMSSTIMDKNGYCSDLGINPEEAEMISLGSEFDIDNRRVFFMPTTKMAFGWNKPENKDKRDKMLDKIVTLCSDIHTEDCGVIHTGSFQIASWLVNELQGRVPQKIIHHNPNSDYSRDNVIAEFTSNNGEIPMLLISPSVTEGLDLKDDQARFAIFAKVPYPYLGDNWVKRRMELSNEWYHRQAMIHIIQGGGRVVRTKDDWGNTYILDSSFSFLWSRMKNKTPQWWKDAFFK